MEQSSQPNSPNELAATVGSSDMGELRLHEFASRIFRNQRMLRVWLPPAYNLAENSDRPYPVFYLNDGQNLFDPATSFTHIDWQVDEAADRLIREGTIPPTIFVGIDNAGVERMKEYLPYRTLNPMILKPRGVRYPQFLLEEVIPFINQNYRCSKGPENMALGGSSLGGLISLHVAIAAPGVFGRMLLESPSLWIGNRQILREARGVRNWPGRIFLGIGTREAGRPDKDRQTVENVRELERIFRRAGFDDHRLRVVVDEGATHSESAWASRFPAALKFLFGN
jgi:predicted alpha/beta superfamily hydrolase